MNSPKVSVIIAAWNRPETLKQAIQSVVDQTFKEWELIVVDDGSPADIAGVVKAWEKKDPRVKYVHNAHTGRIAVVSNSGLRKAKGEYVAIVDDDDWWIDKHKLEKQVAFLDSHPSYIGCGGAFITVDEKGEQTGEASKPETDERIRAVALYANPIANSTGMFRREKDSFYDEGLKQFADWDFWLKMGLKGRLYNFPENFLAYRMWNKGSSFVNQRENADAAFVIVKRYRGLYPGFVKGMFFVTAYWTYARLPVFIRRGMNAWMSRLKKLLFGR